MLGRNVSDYLWITLLKDKLVQRYFLKMLFLMKFHVSFEFEFLIFIFIKDMIIWYIIRIISMFSFISKGVYVFNTTSL